MLRASHHFVFQLSPGPRGILRHVVILMELDHNYQVRHNQARYLEKIIANGQSP